MYACLYDCVEGIVIVSDGQDCSVTTKMYAQSFMTSVYQNLWEFVL